MLDVYCFLAAVTRLLGPPALLLLWNKKTGARFFPALAAFGICLPVFVMGNVIRTGFARDPANPIPFYIKQGMLFGILEEGVKYVMLRYALSNYDSRKDAVSYGIGHSAYETCAGGIACFGLIGTGNARPAIFWNSLFFGVVLGTVSVVSKTILIFYGIRTGKTKIMLPIVILLHAIGNAAQGIFVEEAETALNLVMTVGECTAAYFCWKAMHSPYEESYAGGLK